MKPSDFTSYPWSSVAGKSEAEVVARNIMVILSRTDNEFRELTWKEYKEEREKDGNFSPYEHGYFEEVLPYCKSADTVKLFSKEWDK